MSLLGWYTLLPVFAAHKKGLQAHTQGTTERRGLWCHFEFKLAAGASQVDMRCSKARFMLSDSTRW